MPFSPTLLLEPTPTYSQRPSGEAIERLGPMVIPARRQVRHEPRRGRYGRLTKLERHGDERIGIGDEQLLADQRHSERRAQPADQGRADLRHAVAIGIAKQGDSVRARHRGAGLLLELLEKVPLDSGRPGIRSGTVGFRHQYVAVGQDVQRARMVEAAGESVDPEPGRGDRGRAGRPAARLGDVDVGADHVLGRRELRSRADPGLERKPRRAGAGSERNHEQGRSSKLHRLSPGRWAATRSGG